RRYIKVTREMAGDQFDELIVGERIKHLRRSAAKRKPAQEADLPGVSAGRQHRQERRQARLQEEQDVVSHVTISDDEDQPAGLAIRPSPVRQDEYLWNANSKASEITDTQAAVSRNRREVDLLSHFSSGFIAVFLNGLYDEIANARRADLQDTYIALSEAQSNYDEWCKKTGFEPGRPGQKEYLYEHLLDLCEQDALPASLKTEKAIKELLRPGGMKFTVQQWRHLAGEIHLVAVEKELAERNFAFLVPPPPPRIQHDQSIWEPITSSKRPASMYMEEQESAFCGYHAMNMAVGEERFGDQQARESMFREYLEAKIDGRRLGFADNSAGILRRLDEDIASGEVVLPDAGAPSEVKAQYMSHLIELYNKNEEPLEDTTFNVEDERGVINDFSLQGRGQLSFPLCLRMFRDNLPAGVQCHAENLSDRGGVLGADKVEESWSRLSQQLESAGEELGFVVILDPKGNHFMSMALHEDAWHFQDSQGYGDEDAPCFRRLPGATKEAQLENFGKSLRESLAIKDPAQHPLAFIVSRGTREQIQAMRQASLQSRADQSPVMVGQNQMKALLKNIPFIYERYARPLGYRGEMPTEGTINPCAIVVSLLASRKLQKAAQQGGKALDGELRKFVACINKLVTDNRKLEAAKPGYGKSYKVTPNGIDYSLLVDALKVYDNVAANAITDMAADAARFKQVCEKTHQYGEALLVLTKDDDDAPPLTVTDADGNGHDIHAGHNFMINPVAGSDPPMWRLIEPFMEGDLNDAGRTQENIDKFRPLLDLHSVMALRSGPRMHWSVPPPGRVSVSRAVRRSVARSSDVVAPFPAQMGLTGDSREAVVIAQALSSALNVTVEQESVVISKTPYDSIIHTVNELKRANPDNLSAVELTKNSTGFIKHEKDFDKFEHHCKVALQKNECDAFILTGLPAPEICISVQADEKTRQLMAGVQPPQPLADYINAVVTRFKEWSGEVELIGVKGRVRQAKKTKRTREKSSPIGESEKRTKGVQR
ncbi:MAG TPA: hypothetical protein VM532_13010, partial [Burkholderiales bacterium]|nr:hypothetical protein [Burkholderiales bacterium]